MSLHQTLMHPLFAAALLVGGIMVVPSQAGIRDHLFGDQTGCCKRCPACDYCCDLKAEEVEEERSCFNVETKEICIPKVVFPWQKKTCRDCDACSGLGCTDCVHNGAKVRRICVLKTEKYKCPKCKYTWTPKKKDCVDSCDAGCCDVGCDVGCDVSGSAVEALPMPQSSEAVPATEARLQPQPRQWTPVEVEPLATQNRIPVAPRRLPAPISN